MTSLEDIERLHALHSAGALTDDEYLREKERALSQLERSEPSYADQRNKRRILPQAALVGVVLGAAVSAFALLPQMRDRDVHQGSGILQNATTLGNIVAEPTAISSAERTRPEAAAGWRVATLAEGRSRNAFTIPDEDFQKYSVSYMIGPFKTARSDFGYMSRFAEAERDGVNYAGHYALVEIGCGTQCRTAYAIDGPTGQAIAFPLGGEEYAGLELSYAPTSRLIKAFWPKDLSDPDLCLRSDYVIDSRSFRLVRHYPDSQACPSAINS